MDCIGLMLPLFQPRSRTYFFINIISNKDWPNWDITEHNFLCKIAELNYTLTGNVRAFINFKKWSSMQYYETDYFMSWTVNLKAVWLHEDNNSLVCLNNSSQKLTISWGVKIGCSSKVACISRIECNKYFLQSIYGGSFFLLSFVNIFFWVNMVDNLPCKYELFQTFNL